MSPSEPGPAPSVLRPGDTAQSSVRVEFVCDDDSLPTFDHLGFLIQDTLAVHAVFEGTVSVLLTANEQIARLNRDFRGIDQATDVLTFPASVEDLITGETHLGDIAVAVPYAQTQADIRGVTLEDEVSMLLIHAALHLVGFDDVTDELRAEMQTQMEIAAARHGLPPEPAWTSLPADGYIFEVPA